MEKKSQWAVRAMKCPGESQTVDLLVEWKVEKGKKVLQSLCCNHSRLADFGGSDCQWVCLEKISGKKK